MHIHPFHVYSTIPVHFKHIHKFQSISCTFINDWSLINIHPYSTISCIFINSNPFRAYSSIPVHFMHIQQFQCILCIFINSNPFHAYSTIPMHFMHIHQFQSISCILILPVCFMQIHCSSCTHFCINAKKSYKSVSFLNIHHFIHVKLYTVRKEVFIQYCLWKVQ